ncbi:MAG: type II toxin-antitoxin system RelE/ParE family toxin [Saprospiraceae bacterium]
MQYAVKFSRLAIQDLREICDWYEDKSPGLSDRFLDTLQLTIDQIADNPQRFIEKEGGARMALLHKFPYKVFYMVNETKRSVRVIVLMHRARHPNVWQKRL